MAPSTVPSPRLFTRVRTTSFGAALVLSAHLGRPRALYDLFQELVDPRDEMLVVGLALIASAAAFGYARRRRWVSALLATIDAHPAPQRHHRACVVVWSALLVVTTVCLAATLWWPVYDARAASIQSWFRSEDGLWETLTALGLFGAAGFFVATGVRRAPTVRWTLVAMGVLFFLGGGEEISWGQRIFGFATPEALSAVNVQHEMNLHNIGGYWANYVLMLGILFYLVVLPILEHFFVDVRGIVAFVDLPVPPLAFVPFGFVAMLLGDHPLLTGLWPASTWRLSEAREVLFAVEILGLALDQWLVSRAPDRAVSPKRRA